MLRFSEESSAEILKGFECGIHLWKLITWLFAMIYVIVVTVHGL